MTVDLESLRTPPTRSQKLDAILGILSDLGFETTSWQSGSIQRTLLLGVSAIGADVASLARDLANFGYNNYATGAALREYARSSYDNEPAGAVKTVGPCVLTSTAAVPYTIEVGQLLAGTVNGVDFGNTQSGVLPAGGTLTLNFQALLGGAAGNVPNDSITLLKTPLAGVTISNPAGVGGVWYTTSGADPESTGKLRARNKARWGTLNQIAMPTDGYRYLALSIPAITRVYVDDQNPQGEGSVDVYVATAAGPASSTELTALQALFDQKAPPGARVRALAPSTLAQPVAGTVWIARALNTPAKRLEIEQKVDDFLNSLDIGGLVLPPSTSRVMPRSEVISAISERVGVVAVNLTTPAADVALLPTQLVIPGTKTLTYRSA